MDNCLGEVRAGSSSTIARVSSGVSTTEVDGCGVNLEGDGELKIDGRGMLLRLPGSGVEELKAHDAGGAVAGFSEERGSCVEKTFGRSGSAMMMSISKDKKSVKAILGRAVAACTATS